ncbi:MAG TPA: universal stress protein [Nitrospiria bacterium]|nr:universal stress protein [Nitrospiria bacterium]
MMPLHVHALGSVLALIFSLTMGSFLWWMLHPPRQVAEAAAKARHSLFSVKKILVPTSGHPYSERGIELACRLGHEQKAEIFLAYVMEVPRTMPLDVALPDLERLAEEALKRAESIVILHGLTTHKMVHRSRIAGEEIARIAREKDVDMIVLGIRSHVGLKDEILGRTSDTILRLSPCEVIIDKLPGEGV